MALVRVVVISTVRAKRAPTTVGAIPESETEHRGEPADARVRHPLRDAEQAKPVTKPDTTSAPFGRPSFTPSQDWWG